MKGSWDRDRDPLVALRRGERDLFEEFVRTEAAGLISFFQRLGGSRPEAEDLSQEVFLKLYRYSANYQPQGAFEAFAMRIARNAWIDRRRREAAHVATRPFGPSDDDSAAVVDPPAPASEPSLRMNQGEERARLGAALSRLSANHALIFELAVIQGRPYPEISAELDIPVGTVKSRVFHALRNLRATLEPSEDSADKDDAKAFLGENPRAPKSAGDKR